LKIVKSLGDFIVLPPTQNIRQVLAPRWKGHVTFIVIDQV
jgi:hypothetical protein